MVQAKHPGSLMCAFSTFQSAEAAQEALQINGTEDFSISPTWVKALMWV